MHTNRFAALLACLHAAGGLCGQDPAPPPRPDPIRLLEVELHLLGAAGGSTERDAALGDLQGGAHDPKKRGFTLQQAELALAGAFDPWCRAEASLIASLDPDDGETIVELEEAFLRSQRLPVGLEIKAGTFFTEFGRTNQLHPHAWDWQNQPVIHTRVFGAEGLRGPGARLAWRPPPAPGVEFFLGAHNANGETMASFLANEEFYGERPIGGRSFAERPVRSLGDLVYTLRAATASCPTTAHGLELGASAVFGPNATGAAADTVVYGADFAWRWRKEADERTGPWFTVQGEFVARAFAAAAQIDAGNPAVLGDEVALPGRTLGDHGGYLQGLCGLPADCAAGVRIEWAAGDGASYDPANQTFARATDPYRADRLRISPLLIWRPSESARLRLQYDYDDSDHLRGAAHSVWLGFEITLGSSHSH